MQTCCFSYSAWSLKETSGRNVSRKDIENWNGQIRFEHDTWILTFRCILFNKVSVPSQWVSIGNFYNCIIVSIISSIRRQNHLGPERPVCFFYCLGCGSHFKGVIWNVGNPVVWWIFSLHSLNAPPFLYLQYHINKLSIHWIPNRPHYSRPDYVWL